MGVIILPSILEWFWKQLGYIGIIILNPSISPQELREICQVTSSRGIDDHDREQQQQKIISKTGRGGIVR